MRGIARRYHAALLDGAQGAERLRRRVATHALVRFEQDGIALLLRDRHGDQLVVELAVLPCSGSALVAARGVLVAGLARDLVILGEVFGRLDHAGDDAETLNRLRHHTATREAVVERHIAHTRAVAHRGGIVLHIAHALDAARDDDIGGACLHEHRGLDDGLQPRTTTAIQLEARHRNRQPRRQRRPAADGGRFARGIALREDHIVNPLWGDLRPLDQRADGDGAKLTRADARQCALELADARADRADNGGAAKLGHLGTFL